MKINTRALGKGINLGIINVDKYKSNYFAVNFLLPLNDKNISQCNVLASVLLRGTKKHPSVSAITKHIGMIYDPTVEVSATKTSSALVFKLGAYFLGNEFLPKNDSTDVFAEVTSLFSEMLFEPVTENGALSSAYTESEKKRQADRIKSQINNKDTYALLRCNTHMLGGIPAACNSKGTEEAVNAVTPKSLYEMLDFIIRKCPIEAVYAGKIDEKTEKTLLGFLSSIAEQRAEGNIIPSPELVKPSFGDDIINVTEDISANQGRMIVGFSLPTCGENTAPYEVFNEIFGGSPVSRLFTNVRERLQLCYYCSSAQNLNLGVMYVRSGINAENTELAKEEILSQLENLKSPENISDEELNAAKTGILSAYKTTCDGLTQYASWYVNKRIAGRHTDIERCMEAVRKVDKNAVSEIARGVRPVIYYFLNGTEGGKSE